MAPGGCFCDGLCTGFGDCCGDFTGECAEWAKPIFSGGSKTIGTSLAVDGAGNIYITTHHSGPADLGGGIVPIEEERDIVVTSYDALGHHRWSSYLQAAGGTRFIEVSAAVTDHDTLYLAGGWSGTVSLGETPVLPPTPSPSSLPCVIALDSETGALRWAREIIVPSHTWYTGNALDIALADDGRIAVRTVIMDFPTEGQQFVWLLPNGTIDQITDAPGLGFSDRFYWEWGFTIDSSGNVVAVSDNAESGNSRLVQIGTDGLNAWVRTYPGIRFEDVASLAGGATVAAGSCRATAGCSIGTTSVPAGPVAVQHDLAGNIEWVHTLHLADTGEGEYRRVVVDSAGDIHLTARVYGRVLVGSSMVGLSAHRQTMLTTLNPSGALIDIDIVADSLGPGGDVGLQRVILALSGLRPFEPASNSLAISPNGTRYILDTFYGAVHIRGMPVTGDYDTFLAAVP